MTDTAAILARHVPTQYLVTGLDEPTGNDVCVVDDQDWPCDAHQLGVALGDCAETSGVVTEDLWRRAREAEAREARLRAALPEALRAVCSCTEQCDHDGVEWHAVSADFLAAVLLEQMDALATEAE